MRCQFSDLRFQIVIVSSVLVADLFLQSFFRSRGVGVANDGISFGLLTGNGVWLSFVVLLAFCWVWWSRSRKGSVGWPLIAILLGGVGNLIPRLIFGEVWDYIFISWLPFWFNLSDVLITIGVVAGILELDETANLVRR